MVLHQILVFFSEHACMLISRTPPSLLPSGLWEADLHGDLQDSSPLCCGLCPPVPGCVNGLPLLSLMSLCSGSIFFPNLSALYSSWFCVAPGLSRPCCCPRCLVSWRAPQSLLLFCEHQSQCCFEFCWTWAEPVSWQHLLSVTYLQTLKGPVTRALDQWFLISCGFSI